MSGVDHKDLTSFAKGLLSQKLETRTHRGYAVLKRVLWAIARRSQTRYLTGGTPLNVQTGRLRSSVRVGRIRREPGKIVGTVGTNVFYGRVWEFGASTPGHIVRPVNIDPRTGKVFTHLRFRLGPYGSHGEGMGPWVSVKEVKLAPKPWLAPAVEDTRPFMMREIGKLGMKMASGGK